ncbi:hypothetical protein HK096_009352, partial [Nowakowskiella sp. JEL0078]
KATKTIARRKFMETQPTAQEAELKMENKPIPKEILGFEKSEQNWGLGFGMSAVAIAIGLTAGFLMRK